jgi:hypothetical protein
MCTTTVRSRGLFRATLFCLAVVAIVPLRPARAGFSVDTLSIGGNVERRLYLDSFHFGTLVEQPDGALIFRPHPDQGDVNGWGASYYVNPFLAGGEPSGGAVSGVTLRPWGIEVGLSGTVGAAGGGTYGTWQWDATFTYFPILQRVNGFGSLGVSLPDTLAAADADLNLYRVADNIMTDVPLQTGGTGTTGDMQYAVVRYAEQRDSRDFVWFPPDPDQQQHFPQDLSTFLSVDAVGDTNVVDALALGAGGQIAIARKPSLLVSVESQPADQVIFGGMFAADKAQDFTADNVGMSALVLKGTTASTTFSFDFAIDSVSVPAGSSLQWAGYASEWGEQGWTDGQRPVKPTGGEDMTIAAGEVEVALDYTGLRAAETLVLDGGYVNVSQAATLGVNDGVSVDGGILNVDGLLAAGGLSVGSGEGEPAGTLGGTGTVDAAFVTIAGVLSPGSLPAPEPPEPPEGDQSAWVGMAGAAAPGGPTPSSSDFAAGPDSHAVPEPSTALLASVGALLVLGYASRRRTCRDARRRAAMP